MATTASDTERIKLTENYELQVEISSDNWQEVTTYTFKVAKTGEEERRKRDTPTIDIELPLQRPRPYGWRSKTGEWTPEYDVQYGSLDIAYFDTEDPEEGIASAVALMLASDCLSALHRAAAPELDRQAGERAAKLEAEIKEEEERQAKRDELKEMLQHYVGTQFKLKREGYKATVFGTVDRFTETTLYSTSERGVRMDTRIEDIYFFAIKWEGEKRYEKIYERQPKRTV